MHPSPWPLLPVAHRFTLRIASRGPEATSSVLIGTGRITPEVEHPSRIIWRERGRWQEGPLAGLAFWNSTVWSRDEDGAEISLGHLRRGDDRPTFLVRLEPAAHGRWVATAPHQCGTDRYHASLEWNPASLILRWEVESPTDPYVTILAAGHG